MRNIAIAPIITVTLALIITFALALISIKPLYGQSDPLIRHAMGRVNPVSDYEAFKPLPLPDRINLTWNDDPATSHAVSWRTNPIRLSTGFQMVWKKF